MADNRMMFAPAYYDLDHIEQLQAIGHWPEHGPPPRIWRSPEYQVLEIFTDEQARTLGGGNLGGVNGWPRMIHLSIKRLDREPMHDWRDLQGIKDAIVGPDHEAMELYPHTDRVVDSANQYHLWVIADAGITFPVGFDYSAVADAGDGPAQVDRVLGDDVDDERRAIFKRVTANAAQRAFYTTAQRVADRMIETRRKGGRCRVYVCGREVYSSRGDSDAAAWAQSMRDAIARELIR